MCYGTCKYENWNGECRFINRFPPDAACMMEQWEDDDEEAEDVEESIETNGENNKWRSPVIHWV